VEAIEEILSYDVTEQLKFDHQRLIALVEYLIERDFAGLINVLYRLDVDEEQIKKYSEEKFLTAEVLANFIMQRLVLRAKAREIFNDRYTKDSDDGLVDKW
jgi:hypothetical protein